MVMVFFFGMKIAIMGFWTLYAMMSWSTACSFHQKQGYHQQQCELNQYPRVNIQKHVANLAGFPRNIVYKWSIFLTYVSVYPRVTGVLKFHVECRVWTRPSSLVRPQIIDLLPVANHYWGSLKSPHYKGPNFINLCWGWFITMVAQYHVAFPIFTVVVDRHHEELAGKSPL